MRLQADAFSRSNRVKAVAEATLSSKRRKFASSVPLMPRPFSSLWQLLIAELNHRDLFALTIFPCCLINLPRPLKETTLSKKNVQLVRGSTFVFISSSSNQLLLANRVKKELMVNFL